LERLEDRFAPAVTAAVDATHLLTVTLSAANDTATVRGDVASTALTGESVTVSGTGLTATPFTDVQAILVVNSGAKAGQSVSFTSLGTSTFDISKIGSGAIQVNGVQTVQLGTAGSPLKAASFAENGAATLVSINTNVITTGSQTYGDAVTLTADANFTGSTVNFLEGGSGGGHHLEVTGNAVFGDTAATDTAGDDGPGEADAITGLMDLHVTGTTTFNTSTSLTIMTDAAGNLTVAGTPDFAAGSASQPVGITETTPNIYTISENGVSLATVFAPGNVTVDFSQSHLDDTVYFDFAGNTINGNLSVTEGSGNDSAIVLSPGSVGGNVTFTNVNNVDTTAGVNIGGSLSVQEGSKNLTTVIDLGAPVLESIGGNVQISAGNGTVTVNVSVGGNVAIGGNFTTSLGNGNHTFNFTNGSSVGGDVTYNGGSGQNQVTLGGTVGGNVSANLGAATGTNLNTFTLQTTAVVAGNLTVIEGLTTLGADSVTLQGNGAGAGGAVVAGSASFNLGSAGTTAATGNTWDFQAGASIGGASITYTGGAGFDSVTFNGRTNHSTANFQLGTGTDVFTLGPNTNTTVNLNETGTANTLTVNGPATADTFAITPAAVTDNSQTVNYSGVQGLTVSVPVGSPASDNDTFNVTPSSTTTYTINGSDGSGATEAAGDTLNINLSGTSGGALGGLTQSGDDFSGAYTFSNRSPVNFTAMDKLNPPSPFPVPPPPNFTASDPPAVNEDSGAHPVSAWATFVPPAGETNPSPSYAVSNVSNPGLFAVLPAVDTSGNLTYTLNPNVSGTTTFDVQAQDKGNTSATKTFTLTVNFVNDQPSFTASNQTANEDSGAHTVSNWATFNPGGAPDANELGQAVLAYIVSNVSNPGLFAVLPAVDTSGNLTYTLNPNVSGTTTFDVKVQDNGGTANGGVDTSVAQTFTLTVNFVNDQPSFTASNQTANAGSGAHTVSGWATFNPGSGSNEAGQTVLAYTVSNVSNPGLFAVLPTVDTNGTLTYTLSPNVSGTSTFDVKVQDHGGTANGGVDTSVAQTFTLTVNKVNTTTTVTSSANPSVFGRSVSFTATVSAQAPGAGRPTGTVTFLDGGSPIDTGTLSGGVATFTTSALAEGNQTITASYGGDGNFKGSTGALTGNPQVVNQPPSVSVAFGPAGEVLEVVSPSGVLTQYSAAGAQVLGGGVRSASVAFDPSGSEVLLVTFQDGTLMQFNADGSHVTLGGGVQSASLAFGPQGMVVEVVALDGTLRQFDASGVHLLGGGVSSTSVAFTPAGGEELLVTFQNGALTWFDAAGAHPLGSGGVLSAGLSFDATGAAVVDVLTQDGTLTQYDSAGIHALGGVF
jgi:hypothetical protein